MRRCLAPPLCLLAAARCAAAQSPPAPAAAINWASPALGATATANSAGYWCAALVEKKRAATAPNIAALPWRFDTASVSRRAGYTAEPRYALDDDPESYWSSTGGAVRRAGPLLRQPGVTRAPQVCCSESNPAWLLVSLGALRPVATIQMVHAQDMTFTLALANDSSGPFVTVATQYCEFCTYNQVLRGKDQTTQRTYAVSDGGAPVSASFVHLRVTWSTHGGIGACDDMCDWATNVHRLAVFGPGALPAEALPAAVPPPPAGPFVACPDVIELIERPADLDAGDVLLTGGAELQPPGSGAHGSTAIRLTQAEPLQRGAAEFTRIVRPMEECGACSGPHTLHFSLHVWMGGSRELPGEGLAVSLVDATKQKPGATRFVHVGCGVRLALPLHAVSVVFDTAKNNDQEAGCGGADLHGTGLRLVSTMDADAPPVVLRSTLDSSIAGFRTSGWVPLEFEVTRHGSELTFGPDLVFVNGDEQLTGILDSGKLDSFYVVASATTTAHGADEHSVSMLRLDCWLNALQFRPENWAGYRQPFTPPPMLPPPASPLQVTVTPSTPRLAAVPTFAAAFGVTSALISAAALASWLRRRSRSATSCEVKSLLSSQPLQLACAPRAYEHVVNTDEADEAACDDFDVFLAYRRADFGLADTVHDKLRLCGLRVFKDVEGRMTGKPFGIEIIRAVRNAPIFAPVVTLASLQRMAGAADPDAEVDACLAEWLAALHFRAAGRVQLIYPLLLGSNPLPGQKIKRFESLTDDPQYTLALAALPDAASPITTRVVSGALCAMGEAPLSAEVAAMTVRSVAAAVLATPVFAVNCLPDDLGLYVRGRYAAPMLRVAAEARAARTKPEHTAIDCRD